MKFEKIKKIIAYHGTSHTNYQESPFRLPLFVTTERDGADWYAENHNGLVLKGTLLLNNVLDFCEGDTSLHDILKLAGIPFKDTPYFDCPTIAQHSPYDGSNPSDVVYIPEFQKKVIELGYDSIHLWDSLCNYEIDTYILLKPEQFVPHKRKPKIKI
jgi:hypothetical protein